MGRRKTSPMKADVVPTPDYDGLVERISELLEQSRRGTARAVNRIITATYWQIGRYVVEFEQRGRERAEYGAVLIERLAKDLTVRYGRGFSHRNLWQMRAFFLGWEICQTPSGVFDARAIYPSSYGVKDSEILQTLSAEFPSVDTDVKPSPSRRGREVQTPSASPPPQRVPNPDFSTLLGAFPMSWSHYVRLMSVGKPHARAFYEAEAIRGGWSVRQLDRQISTQFFERVSASKRQEAMLGRARAPKAEDAVSARDELHDPYLLEFLDLKDEYGESDLEEAIIRRLESSCWRWALASPSSRGRSGSESATSGTGWICSSTIAYSAAWWSSTSKPDRSPMPTPGR